MYPSVIFCLTGISLKFHSLEVNRDLISNLTLRDVESIQVQCAKTAGVETAFYLKMQYKLPCKHKKMHFKSFC